MGKDWASLSGSHSGPGWEQASAHLVKLPRHRCPWSGPSAPTEVGNALPLKAIPAVMPVHAVEIYRGKGAPQMESGCGMGLEAMQWLMEEKKGILFGVDTAAFECDSPDPTNPAKPGLAELSSLATASDAKRNTRPVVA